MPRGKSIPSLYSTSTLLISFGCGVATVTAKTDRKRTVASAVTYRITSTILLGAISYFVTGQWVESITVTLTFALIATVLYYINDRTWERTDWGRKA
jgi:uncharacterized membrane protein